MHVDSDEYALELARYIHLNPVAAGFVNDPSDWEFSDFRQWASDGDGGLTDLSLRKTFFDSGSDYARYVWELCGFSAAPGL